MSAGIGRQKELNLDEIDARHDYLLEQWRDPSPDAQLVAALLVVADVLHDVEKKLALLNHTIESRQ